METTSTSVKTKWNIDAAHSEIGFRVKHLMIANVRGTFREYYADIFTTDDDFMTAGIDFRMKTASITTGDDKRDAHLKSADFFDVENFSELRFIAASCDRVNSDGNYKLYGDLTIKGITRRIELDVEFGGFMKDPWGNQKAVFSINGKIKRTDWGLNWNAALETGGLLVSEDVWINCEIQLAKEA
jgi:polyisoprenoid-binding protein YceI